MNNRTEKYTDGFKMGCFKRIPEISYYNHNYYIGLDNDLLFALSNDDDMTEWFLISGINYYPLGESFVSNGNTLVKMDF